jgi:Tfp pilus assembly protein PilF
VGRRALAYEKKGRWEDARKEYEAAVALDPGDINIRHNFERFQENMAVWKDFPGKPRDGRRP